MIRKFFIVAVATRYCSICGYIVYCLYIRFSQDEGIMDHLFIGSMAIYMFFQPIEYFLEHGPSSTLKTIWSKTVDFKDDVLEMFKSIPEILRALLEVKTGMIMVSLFWAFHSGAVKLLFVSLQKFFTFELLLLFIAFFLIRFLFIKLGLVK